MIYNISKISTTLQSKTKAPPISKTAMAYGRESNNIESNNIWLIYEPKLQEEGPKLDHKSMPPFPNKADNNTLPPFKDPLDLIF